MPRVVVGGAGGTATSSGVMEGLLTLLLSDKLGMEVRDIGQREPNPEADQLRAQIRESLKESRQVTSEPLPPAPAGPSAKKPA